MYFCASNDKHCVGLIDCRMMFTINDIFYIKRYTNGGCAGLIIRNGGSAIELYRNVSFLPQTKDVFGRIRCVPRELRVAGACE